MFTAAYLQRAGDEPLPILTKRTGSSLLIECSNVDEFIASIMPTSSETDDRSIRAAEVARLPEGAKVRAALIDGEGLFVDVVDDLGTVIFSSDRPLVPEAESLLRGKLLWQVVGN